MGIAQKRRGATTEELLMRDHQLLDRGRQRAQLAAGEAGVAEHALVLPIRCLSFLRAPYRIRKNLQSCALGGGTVRWAAR